MVLLGISLLDFEEKRKKTEESISQKNEDISIYERIFLFSKAISPTLLPMIASLGDLEIETLARGAGGGGGGGGEGVARRASRRERVTESTRGNQIAL